MTGLEIAIAAVGTSAPVALFGYLKHRAPLRYLHTEREAGVPLPELTEAVGTLKDGTLAHVLGELSKAVIAGLSRSEHALKDARSHDAEPAMTETWAREEAPKIISNTK